MLSKKENGELNNSGYLIHDGLGLSFLCDFH